MMLFVIEHLDCAEDIALADRLYREYMPFVKSRIYNKVNDINVCEDLAQDCMVNMIKYLDSIKKLPEDKIRAYVSVSVNNLVINYQKRASRQVKNGIYDLSDNYELTDGFSVEEEIEQKCDYETIRAGFDRLRERDKSIISMKYDLELSDGQISDVLDIKQDCVRMTVLRSVRRLKKQIKKIGGEIK